MLYRLPGVMALQQMPVDLYADAIWRLSAFLLLSFGTVRDLGCLQLNIEHDRVARLASELARVTGESVSRAVTLAIEERLARERAKPRAERPGIAAQLLALGDEMSRLPVLDDRPGDEILYDEAGLPKGRDVE